MGKKIKKDEKGPPDDVFDALLVESKQAATVVLMLESPEEDVLSKACEAIYRFVEKCDENRKTLLDLNCIDPLLRLVQHEERTVRRNACMALGVMAAHPDVRKALRKREETIPAMIQLMAPEEDTVVHEFSALCLASMANDFSSKVTIQEQDGMESLIRLLASNDPDVQKNAIETISLLLQDYAAKSAVRELSGFPPILDLTKSDYPVIQHLALVSLQRATEDAIPRPRGLEVTVIAPPTPTPKEKGRGSTSPSKRRAGSTTPRRRGERGSAKKVQQEIPEKEKLTKFSAENRAALRELEGINAMINFIGKPEWSDLHVFAVCVISNCLEDPESLEMIKENGGLAKLVAFITDTQPPEEEEKKGKKGEKGASRAGKKGKGGDDVNTHTAYKDESDDEGGAHSSGHVSRMNTSSRVGTNMGSRSGTATKNTRLGLSSSLQSSASKAGYTGGKPGTSAGKASALGKSSKAGAGKRGGRTGATRLSVIAASEGTESPTGSEYGYMPAYEDHYEATDDKNRARGGGEADPIITTLPEVKEHAAKSIARAAKNADNRKLLHEQECEKMLILLLTHENPDVQVAAAQALGVMSENLIAREAIGQWDGLEPLIKMCKNDNPNVREAASMALANLTTSNMFNCNEVSRLHGVEPLITMLSDSRELAIANAAVVLTNMAPDESMRSEIQRQGVVQALIEPLKSSNTVVQSKAALAVAAFVGDAEAREALRENNGVEPLVELLKSGNDDVRRSASWAISVCAVDEPTAVEVCKFGGLDILQEVQLSSTRKNAFTNVALDKILDSNLASKYALKGVLGTGNLITDGFFDVGQLRPGAPLLSLEDYYKLDVNQKRPVLLINAQPEKPQTPAPQPSDLELNEKSSKSSVTGRSSRTGRESKAKARARKEEERQREEEARAREEASATPSGDQPFVPPGDNNLCKYIEEVQDRIMPLPSTKDQVVALASYVAEKMGGPIERGQLANFSWELPISQLKFDMKTNVIPIGMIKCGIHYHRALLFKALADRIAVHCTLVRGEYNRAWNEVMLTDDDDAPGAPTFPPKPYLVDLIHSPGRLLPSDGGDAINYQKL